MIYIIIIAIILDIIFGDPEWFPHPVIYIGKIISFLERILFHQEKKIFGLFMVIATLLSVWGILELIFILSDLINIKTIVTIFLLYTSLAIKSLRVAGLRVHKALKNDIHEARKKLSYIVSRDTSKLNKEEIIRGTIETVSENTIDGVLAPLFYILIGAIFSLPVHFVFIYKTINTLDSMIGYKNEKYINFGYFAAKLDDIANFIPARIGSLLMLISGLILRLDFKNGVKVFIRDRKKHKSPNAGHPESVVAGLLNIRLGGPNMYFGKIIEKPWIGNNTKIVSNEDIIKTINILYVSSFTILLSLILYMVII